MEGLLQTLRVFISALTFFTLCLAILRFWLKRERRTFLDLGLSASVIKEAEGSLLVAVTVHLENKGQTRISAGLHNERDPFLYQDDGDECKHAGTLKLHRVSDKCGPLVFDWYSLEPMTGAAILEDGEEKESADFEQINYIAESDAPEVHYHEVSFRLEPNQAYDFLVPVWLRPGTYAMKAYYIGGITKHGEEEYWSCLGLFHFQASQMTPANGGPA